MRFSKLFMKSKCPHCGKYSISYWEKMNLIDYRYSYECKECEGTIKLPAWHALLYLTELISMMIVTILFKMATWQVIISFIIVFFFISFIQLPFIPIKG